MENEEKSVFDMLFDPDNNENIFLYDENQEKVEFEQIAIIPFKNEMYAILKPVKEMENVADDEALVFLLEENEDGEELLTLSTDEKICENVFEEYFKLFDDENK